MRLENSKDKKSPLDDFKGLFVRKKSTESVPLFQVEYGLSLILTRCVVSNGFKIYRFILFLQVLTDKKNFRKIVSESFSLVSN